MPPRQQQQQPPRKLTKQQHTYFMLGLPIGVIAVSVALVGLCVLWDVEKKTALANTQFAVLWLKAVQHNPFVQAFMLNFGAIGVVYSISRLREHNKALKLEQEEELNQQQQAESRKER